MRGLERGVFTLSLDFELIWGTLDLFGPEGFRQACQVEREQVIGRLVDALRRHEVSATWCVLGHLLLEGCPPIARKHPEIVRPRHSWTKGDWFQHDPGGTEATAPLFFGRTLVEMVRACPVPQELACHSFSHVIFGDPGCSRETAESEIDACLEAARQLGLALRSFAFPRNSVGHLDVLQQKGFVCFRGPGARWYEQDDSPGLTGRLAHLLDVLIARSPGSVLPERVEGGLWNVPGSMIYFPAHGIRRYIPTSRRVARARKGIEDAIARRRVFHLWFHPTNLADQPDQMFEGLEKILDFACAARDRGEADILTMGGVADLAAECLSVS